jgi:hypothetical protein
MQKYGISSGKHQPDFSGPWTLPENVRNFAADKRKIKVKKLKGIYEKYKDYAQTDVLMYLAFVVFLVILFVFFR